MLDRRGLLGWLSGMFLLSTSNDGASESHATKAEVQSLAGLPTKTCKLFVYWQEKHFAKEISVPTEIQGGDSILTMVDDERGHRRRLLLTMERKVWAEDQTQMKLVCEMGFDSHDRQNLWEWLTPRTLLSNGWREVDLSLVGVARVMPRMYDSEGRMCPSP